MHSDSQERFAQMLAARVRAIRPRTLTRGECQTRAGQICSLCHASRLTYAEELEVKQAALQEFAREALGGTCLATLVPSPGGRAYRMTTKRKVFRSRSGVELGLIDPDREGRLRALEVLECVIEPRAHGVIYAHVREFLGSPAGRSIAQTLQHVVVRGGEAEQTLILTVPEISGPVLQGATRLSKMLGPRVPSIIGAFLYEDVGRGSHYLGTAGPGAHPASRKIFGKSELFLRVAGKPFLFSPFVFSQVNAMLLETMVHTVAELLDLDQRGTLYDLYCGYGLFALSLAEKVRSVVGIEISAASVAAARRNADRQGIGNARFMTGKLNGERVGAMLRDLKSVDRLLLDPPRNGAGEDVIEAAAARRPRRVVHIVCNIELLSRELRRWEAAGYHALRAVPLDMFPGTSTIETVIGLQPG